MNNSSTAAPLNKPVEQAKNDLLRALPYFRKAIADAKKTGAVKLGILSTHPDGSGKVEMQFDCEEFFEDIALVIGAPPQTNADENKASAVKFLQTHGLR